MGGSLKDLSDVLMSKFKSVTAGKINGNAQICTGELLDLRV
jgi:hypothetical protein